MKRVAVLGWVFLAACTRTVTPAATSPTPVQTVEAASPSPTSMAAATMPPPTFEGFPGWLGLATTTEGGSDDDAPAYAAAHVALENPQAWAAAGAARFRALAPGYSDEVGFLEAKKIPFGCDGGTEKFAFFKGATRPPRGAVWLVSGDTGSVLPVEKLNTPAAVFVGGAKEMRAWQIGTRTFVTKRTSKALTSEIWEGEKRVWREEAKWDPMQGGDPEPPSLEGGPGVSIPRMVLVSGTSSLLVVQTGGWEGTNFTGFHLEKGSARRAEGGLYLYWCAF